MGEKRNTYGVLVGIPEGKSKLLRLRHRRNNNIMMDFKMIVWEVWMGFTLPSTGTSDGLL
jgi:hypothetical protein